MGFLNKDPQTLAESMAEMHENMLHLAETAQGYRTALEAMGWSPAMAEALAGHFLIQLHETVFKK